MVNVNSLFVLGLCPVQAEVAAFVSECNVAYSRGSEEQGSFSDSWDVPSFSNNISGPWIFQGSDELGSVSHWGYVSSYSGNGYSFTHSVIGDEALSGQKDLFDQGWLNRYTRAVFVEFTLFNQDTNLFAIVNMVLENSATGWNCALC